MGIFRCFFFFQLTERSIKNREMCSRDDVNSIFRNENTQKNTDLNNHNALSEPYNSIVKANLKAVCNFLLDENQKINK